MDDLTAFISARLDEDEEAANEVHLPRDCGCVDRDGEFSPDPAWCGCKRPARELREVAAKRARLALLDKVVGEMDRLLGDDDAAKIDQGVAIGWKEAVVFAVKQDAAVYADHPDYRAEWAPQGR